MNTRSVKEIKKDLRDAKRELRDIEINSYSAIPVSWLSAGCSHDDAVDVYTTVINDYKQELEEAIRCGEQLAFDI